MPQRTPSLLLDLPAARALQHGFQRLRFDPAIEQEFRAAHLRATHRWVRLALLVSLTTTLGFAVIDHFVLRINHNGVPDLVRFGLQLPILLLVLLATSQRFYQRWYMPGIQIGAPLFGLGTVVMASYAAPEYVALVGARLLLVIFFVYFLLGARFFAALRSNAIILFGYAVAAGAGAIGSGIAVYTLWTLLCAMVIGAAGAYALEFANRLAFLERRLLVEIASHDGLTGLLNRRAFDDQVRDTWRRAAELAQPLSIMMIDIDHFKAYNDRYGHPAGDECLRKTAQSLRTAIARSPGDLIARYGGEEFIAVLANCGQDQVQEAARAAHAAITAMGLPHEASPTGSLLTVSIGTASCRPEREVSHEAALQLADHALYRAKSQGRNGCVCLAA